MVRRQRWHHLTAACYIPTVCVCVCEEPSARALGDYQNLTKAQMIDQHEVVGRSQGGSRGRVRERLRQRQRLPPLSTIPATPVKHNGETSVYQEGLAVIL